MIVRSHDNTHAGSRILQALVQKIFGPLQLILVENFNIFKKKNFL